MQSVGEVQRARGAGHKVPLQLISQILRDKSTESLKKKSQERWSLRLLGMRVTCLGKVSEQL